MFAVKDVYIGSYELGLPHGANGHYKWKSGAVYTGEFFRGRKQGTGKWKKNEKVLNCNQYTGEYFEDMKHGQGEFRWESGNIYKGAYENDRRHGYGELIWHDGTIYKGAWQFGVQHGIGQLWLPDGDFKEGMFENNVYIGPAEEGQEDKPPSPIKKEDAKITLQEDRTEAMGFAS